MATNAKNLAELLNTDTTVKVGDIEDGSVTTAKLANDAVTAAKLADDSVVTANISAGAIEGTGVSLGRRNHIINGNFSIAQRATSASSSAGQYVSLDRWKTWVSGAATTFSQQTFSPGQTDVPATVGDKYARLVIGSNSGNGDYSTLSHHIENVTLSNSQQMTLSFYAKASTGGMKIGIEPIQNFGSGGSPSSRVLIAGTAKTLTTSWARYTHTFTYGSISGKTLGTDANSSNFEIGFWFSGGSDYNSRTGSIGNQTGTFEIAGVQLENGDTATDFEHRTISEEFALCQRYFQKMGPFNTSDYPFGISGYVYGAVNSAIGAILNMPMRIDSPTVSMPEGNMHIRHSGNSNTAIGISAINNLSGALSGSVRMDVSHTSTTNGTICVMTNAQTLYTLRFDAEL